MKTFLTIALIATGAAVAAAPPAEAAFVAICASPVCGSASPNTTFNLNDFENGFDVDDAQVQKDLGSPTHPSVSQIGSFVDGAAQNTFSGSWLDNGETPTESGTVFFTDASGAISDVLNFNYSNVSGFLGSLTGYVITGALSAADLAGLGITPTSTAPEGELFSFDNAHISASFQTAAPAVPEPSTWAMLLVGFAGLGFAGHRRAARARPALTA